MDSVETYKEKQSLKGQEVLKDDDISISKAAPRKDGRANGAIIIMLYTGYYRIL